MRLALYQPDIAQNTGTILRLAACFATPVDVIGPTGFDISDRALRRAGMDYLNHVDLRRHASYQAFLDSRTALAALAPEASGGRLVLLTSRASTSIYDFAFRTSDTLMLGRESAGVPDAVHAGVDARLKIPIRVDLRSLNLAVAAGIVLAEALRQTGGLPS
ncbi:MAG: tRNA (cytidine(34)-2'-O)-methyltransferase [Hyphomicrobium sp.]|nr:tRNA (cytidine(34)-2'-O)-methyltransferase [Hyphomicrobium sp.]